MKRLLIESTPYEGLKNGTHIDVEVYYDIGGMNYFSGRTSPRGYYVSVTPVTRKDNMISHVTFKGYKQLLFETSRFSANQFKRAVEMGRSIAPGIVERVLNEEKAA